MSFTDGTPAAMAIIYSIFALATVHLNDQPRARKYKAKAMRAVSDSSAQGPNTADTFRRIVAANLLAVFEVSPPTPLL